MFKIFFKKEGFRTISEKQLVAELSKRAKHLCEDLEGILDINEDEAENETERKTIISLKHLWDVAAKSHDKSRRRPDWNNWNRWRWHNITPIASTTP